jgi:AraC-like DNA-binding protein
MFKPLIEIMDVQEANTILQIACITILCLVCLLLIKHARSGLNSWTGIGLSASVICYLVVETKFVQDTTPFFVIALTGAISVPVLFFLLTKAIFDDHFKPSFLIGLWFLIQVVPHLHIYLREKTFYNDFAEQLAYAVAEITSLGFVLAGLYIAIKTKKGDLIESRLHFRSVFIAVTAGLIGITLIVEAIPAAREAVAELQNIQRSSILALTTYFLISNFEIRPGFFFKETQIQKSVVPEDNHLRKKLESLIEEKKIYRKEGLTIRELAEIMNEQEYRLRRMINGELGFKNFNDFLNQYRVKEASEILSDPSQNRKTILEIAYSLGYQSIGPFNKAFKELKNTTPTSFRKSIQN